MTAVLSGVSTEWPMGEPLSHPWGKALHMSHHRSKNLTGGYEAGTVRLDFVRGRMEQHGARVVQLEAWRLRRRLSTGDPELVALGAGLEVAACECFELKLPKFGNSPSPVPVAYVALSNAKGGSSSDLCAEVGDDFRVGHSPYYWPANIGLRINSSYHDSTISKMESIGERIATLRKGLGLNQTQLALQVGVNQSSISAIENGASFGADVLMSLSVALFKSPQFIMTGKEAAVELSDEEARMIAAYRAIKPAGPPPTKRAETAKAVSSPMSKAKAKKRGAA